jgi:IS30 family transposase
MATPGKPLDEHTRRLIARWRHRGGSIRAAARELGISRNTVRRYWHKAANFA